MSNIPVGVLAIEGFVDSRLDIGADGKVKIICDRELSRSVLLVYFLMNNKSRSQSKNVRRALTPCKSAIVLTKA